MNSTRRRIRKAQLARRHGARCAYCRARFADLKAATLDHVVPRSLYPTWRVQDLVLACVTCNNRKDDALPLSVALLLCARYGQPQPVTPTPDLVTPAVTQVSAPDQVTAAAGTRVQLVPDAPRVPDRDGPDRPDRDGYDVPVTVVRAGVDWLLLVARLAHARQSARSTHTTPPPWSTHARVHLGRLHPTTRAHHHAPGLDQSSQPNRPAHVDRSGQRSPRDVRTTPRPVGRPIHTPHRVQSARSTSVRPVGSIEPTGAVNAVNTVNTDPPPSPIDPTEPATAREDA
ncbi:HNH endonuclease [Streptomyces buecherae]|uniref:HNH endonuclease n=1 Tax=Streptomyces buecherae TaxID=2763006 RepID=UPI001C9A8AD1|nr:HNH endonuclease signature motif containing protein [Streptomyces buecherae]